MATDSLLLVNATDDDLLGTNAALYTSAAFAVAGFVHGVTGFGAGMTAMAIAPLGMQLMDAVAIVAIYVLVVCLALSFMLRESLSNPAVRSMLPPLCAGSVLGVPLGVKLLTQTDPRLLKILLGASMVAFVVERILHECKHAQDPSREASPRSSKTNSPEALWGADSNESPARRSPPGVAATVARKAACRGEGGDGAATAGGAESAERRLLPSGTLLSSMATDVGGGGYLAPPSLSLWGPAGPLALSPSPALASAAASYVGSAVDGASEATGGAISKGYAPFASPRLSPSSRSRLERVSYWGEELSDAEPPNHCKGCWQRGREMTAGFAIGAASGLLDGALNEGGPPVIIFVTLQVRPKSSPVHSAEASRQAAPPNCAAKLRGAAQTTMA